MMPRIRAKREAEARQRTNSALSSLAAQFGLESALDTVMSVPTHNADVRRLKEWEALADFVELLEEAIANHGMSLGEYLDETSQVTGVGEATMSAIRAHFEELG